MMLSLPESSNEEESPDKTEFEASSVAKRIGELLDSGMQIYENGEFAL
jgi:hypothetical protein